MIQKEYATALFELGLEDNKVGALLEELTILKTVLSANPEYMKLLTHPKVSKSEKKELLGKVLKNFSEAFTHFCYVLIDNSRFDVYEDLLEEYSALVHQSENRMVVRAISRVALKEADIKKLESQLSEEYKKSIEIIPIVDELVIDGIRLEFGGRVLDATLRANLNDLKSIL